MNRCRQYLFSLILFLIIYKPLYSYPTPKFDVNESEVLFKTGDIIQADSGFTLIVTDYSFSYNWYQVQYIILPGLNSSVGTTWIGAKFGKMYYKKIGNIYE